MIRLIINLCLNVVTLGWWGRRLGERRDYRLHIDPGATFEPKEFHPRYDDIPANVRDEHKTKPRIYR